MTDVATVGYRQLDDPRFMNTDIYEKHHFDTPEFGRQLLMHAVKCGASDIIVRAGLKPLMVRHNEKWPLLINPTTIDEFRALLEYWNTGAYIQLEKGGANGLGCAISIQDDERNDQRFRMHAIATQKAIGRGFTITLRHIPNDIPPLTDLDVPADILSMFDAFDKGLVFVIGATGSGKSTLQAAAWEYIAKRRNADASIITIEDPVEFVLEAEYDTSIAQQFSVGTVGSVTSFSAGIHETLRMKPSHVGIGEMRGIATLDAAFNASSQGHGVMGTIHATDTMTTFDRILNEYPGDQHHRVASLLVSNTRAFITQHLEKRADEEGLVAIREVLIITASMRQSLVKAVRDRDVPSVLQSLVKEHGQLMMDDAKSKLEKSIISEASYLKMAANFPIREQIA